MFPAVLKELVGKLASNEVSYDGARNGTRDVPATDTTVVNLHRSFARLFPGPWENLFPAAAKWRLVMRVSGKRAHKVEVPAGNDHSALWMRA